jgi:hypothetical protein
MLWYNILHRDFNLKLQLLRDTLRNPAMLLLDMQSNTSVDEAVTYLASASDEFGSFGEFYIGHDLRALGCGGLVPFATVLSSSRALCVLCESPHLKQLLGNNSANCKRLFVSLDLFTNVVRESPPLICGTVLAALDAKIADLRECVDYNPLLVTLGNNMLAMESTEVVDVLQQAYLSIVEQLDELHSNVAVSLHDQDHSSGIASCGFAASAMERVFCTRGGGASHEVALVWDQDRLSLLVQHISKDSPHMSDERAAIVHIACRVQYILHNGKPPEDEIGCHLNLPTVPAFMRKDDRQCLDVEWDWHEGSAAEAARPFNYTDMQFHKPLAPCGAPIAHKFMSEDKLAAIRRLNDGIRFESNRRAIVDCLMKECDSMEKKMSCQPTSMQCELSAREQLCLLLADLTRGDSRGATSQHTGLYFWITGWLLATILNGLQRCSEVMPPLSTTFFHRIHPTTTHSRCTVRLQLLPVVWGLSLVHVSSRLTTV